MKYALIIGIERLLALFVVVFVMAICPPAIAQKGSKITTVVIDPGHGGRDPGAVGRKSKEKDIVLDVALRTGKLIQQNLPDVKVIYTRSRDEFVELHRRASIANQADADLFISIHCNASKDSRASGAETFVMGEHRTSANLDVAKLENASILLEDNYSEEYGDFDPNSTAAYIALSLYQSENKNQSIRFAQSVQEQFTKRLGRKDRSVQQAGFLVLYRTTMPSVLVELGFITNQEEEAFMMSDEGKNYMASAIYRAFRDYKQQFERENASSVITRAMREEAVRAENTVATAAGPQPSAAPSDETAHRPLANTPPGQGQSSNPAKTPAKPAQEAPKQNIAKPPAENNTIIYKVQFATFPQDIPLTDKRFKQIEKADKYFHNGLYKYTSGHFTIYRDAVNHQNMMRKSGYADAFVIAFLNGKRITIEEAQKSTRP
ncbi:MAG TPA: N-acetylmuramoyl-L-alanine amidase [Bacteroidales bacterium]|nr:N-acetylmuramoyl-L-alanine amidase [Bacteroidales bacterium]